MAATPGPNFLVTLQASIAYTSRIGVATAAGIAFGTLIWATGSVFGLSLIFDTNPLIFKSIKILGALYLIYLGGKFLLCSNINCHDRLDYTPKTKQMSVWKGFSNGLAIDLTNPKAAFFFSSLFANNIPDNAPTWFISSLILSIVLLVATWYGSIAMMADRWDLIDLGYNFNKTLLKVTGLILFILGSVSISVTLH